MVSLGSLNRRLAALARAAEAARPLTKEENLARARAGLEDGTITVEQARLLQRSGELEWSLEPILREALFLIAQEKAGDTVLRDGSIRAFWYPPDCELPADVQALLDTDFAAARTPFAEWRKRERWQEPDITMSWRLTAVCWAAGIGDRRALRVRYRVWGAVGQQWVPSEEVMNHAKATWLSPEEGDRRLGGYGNRSFSNAVNSGLVITHEPPAGSRGSAGVDLVEFTEAYERLGLGHGTGNPAWSDQVKSGHAHPQNHRVN